MTAPDRRPTVSFLFCDQVGSTAMLERLGEAANDELRRDLFAALRRPIDVFGGIEVKSQGDGFMVAFPGGPDEWQRYGPQDAAYAPACARSGG